MNTGYIGFKTNQFINDPFAMLDTDTQTCSDSRISLGKELWAIGGLLNTIWSTNSY